VSEERRSRESEGRARGAKDRGASSSLHARDYRALACIRRGYPAPSARASFDAPRRGGMVNKLATATAYGPPGLALPRAPLSPADVYLLLTCSCTKKIGAGIRMASARERRMLLNGGVGWEQREGSRLLVSARDLHAQSLLIPVPGASIARTRRTMCGVPGCYLLGLLVAQTTALHVDYEAGGVTRAGGDWHSYEGGAVQHLRGGQGCKLKLGAFVQSGLLWSGASRFGLHGVSAAETARSDQSQSRTSQSKVSLRGGSQVPPPGTF
jgi:hypothetical protein